jgi:hypothetical protein
MQVDPHFILHVLFVRGCVCGVRFIQQIRAFVSCDFGADSTDFGCGFAGADSADFGVGFGGQTETPPLFRLKFFGGFGCCDFGFGCNDCIDRIGVTSLVALA